MFARSIFDAEVLNSGLGRGAVSHVVFDFDGTISWLRSGWPDVMSTLFLEQLGEDRGKLTSLEQLRCGILALNGKPSVYQMQWFVDYAKGLGASPAHSDALLALYLERLREMVAVRVRGVKAGVNSGSVFLIEGVESLLQALNEKGLRMFIVSGTAEAEVREEAKLLGIGSFFGENIYGSTPGRAFSKKDVFQRILNEERIHGRNLLSFGDGPVEIHFTKAVGGIAIGVASDERVNGSGQVDQQKREHLIRAGADAIIPDYRNTRWILETLFP